MKPQRVDDVWILFTGEGPKLEFVEVEDADGNGVRVGTWENVRRGDHNYQALKLRVVSFFD